jgi:hypothetical protein
MMARQKVGAARSCAAAVTVDYALSRGGYNMTNGDPVGVGIE